MPELRHDPLTGRSVIVAAERATRPHQFATPPDDTRDGPCPFCPGHEAETPPEVARTGGGVADGPGWRVRVVPNLYPIVGGPHAEPGAGGAHEVVVLSPDHHRSFALLDDDAAVEVFTMMRDRVRAQYVAGHRFAVAIVNHRRAAGASIAHPHAQVVALDFVPTGVTSEVELVDEAGYDLVIADSENDSLVVQREPALVWCPYASASPATMRIALADAGSRFDLARNGEIRAVAIALRDALSRLSSWLDDPPYNVVVHSAPPDATAAWLHWYVEVTPRLSVVAGFEQATGVLVNTLAPEQAAIQLRERAP